MRNKSLFWGLVLILLGALFLLQNSGLLAIDVWELFWPLLLIVLGLSVLLQRASSSTSEMETLDVPLRDATKARIKLRHGAGRLRLGSGAGPGSLLSGEFGGGVKADVRPEGSTVKVALRQPSDIFPFRAWGSDGLNWEIALNPGVVLTLDVEAGANDSRLDLSDLLVSELRLRTGASATRVIMPAGAGYTEADIRSGAAAVTVEIPPDVAASIRTRGALATVDIDQERFPRQGQMYRSSAYEAAQNKVEINVETGVGTITIR